MSELINATYRGDLVEVNRLLGLGADVHAKNDGALRWASQSGYVEMVEVLLVNGADIHARNDEALRYASYRGYIGVIVKLVEVGANLRIFQKHWIKLFGRSTPDGLVEMSSSKVVELLLAEAVKKELV